MNLSKARRKVFYIILSEFHVPMKLVRLTDVCLNKTYKVSVAKHVSDLFHTQNCLKEGNVLPPLLFNMALESIMETVKETQADVKLNGTCIF
jgi:hypothetical protein